MVQDSKYSWGGTRLEVAQSRREEDARYDRANKELAKRIWEVIQYHYPGHPWGVFTNIKQGIAMIELPVFTTYSFVINLKDLVGDPRCRVLVRGAGEFLERYNLPRSGFDISHYLAAKAKFRPLILRDKLAA